MRVAEISVTLITVNPYAFITITVSDGRGDCWIIKIPVEQEWWIRSAVHRTVTRVCNVLTNVDVV